MKGRRDWTPNQPVPERFSGMPVTFAWNDVALTTMLRALKEGYPSGYASMVDHVREAMRNYTPPKPEEPIGLGAVVEVDGGVHFVRLPDGMWTSEDESQPWSRVNAVRVLSKGVVA